MLPAVLRRPGSPLHRRKNTESGPLDVDAADLIARTVLAEGIDTALSERMVLDHGFAEPLQLLLGSITAKPVVPLFINAVGEPLGPVRRIRLLGDAVVKEIRERDA